MENPLVTKIRVTKKMYKLWDSYNRLEKWRLKNLVYVFLYPEHILPFNYIVKEDGTCEQIFLKKMIKLDSATQDQ
jgi:hypothetical protein